MYSDVMVIAGRAVPVDNDAWSNTTIAAVYPPADVRWFKKAHRSAEVRALSPRVQRTVCWWPGGAAARGPEAAGGLVPAQPDQPRVQPRHHQRAAAGHRHLQLQGRRHNQGGPRDTCAA